MPRVSAAFFAIGVIYLLLGMSWGMHMGASEDFSMMPAHAHLNLLGWVTMSIYGGFYALTQNSMSPRLAWINYGLATLGVAIMIPTLAVFLTTGNQALGPVIGLGGVLNIIALLTFSLSAFREFKRARLA